ncbi:alanine racemase [Brachybacterium huguangmaarense]
MITAPDASPDAAAVPRDLDAVATPAVVVDVPRLERNIADAQAAIGSRVDLRPHVKTSKCLEVARRQREAGAIGFTCSTAAEVTLLGEEGLGDLLWAYPPVGPPAVAFAVEASARFPLTLLVESLDGARPLAEAAVRAGRTVRAVLDVDTGHHRTGVSPDEAVARFEAIAALDGIDLVGLLTHEGHAAAAGADGREDAARRAGEILTGVASELRARGHGVEIVSIGSTPGMSSAPFVDGITEARPGTYVYFDANQYRLGSCEPGQWALTVLSRVLSTEGGDGRSTIIDAGLKAMSSDTLTAENGAGIVCDLAGTPLEDVRFTTANEEHGFLEGPGTVRLRVGDLVRIVPNHACGTVNMWSRALAVGADGSAAEWEIRARR